MRFPRKPRYQIGFAHQSRGKCAMKRTKVSTEISWNEERDRSANLPYDEGGL